jgi:uncharacterized protein (TIGR04222 family)
MSPDQPDLLARIRAFDIDGPGPAALPFAARLARENGWSPGYAARVVREYKRYAFLAVTSAEPVCPSEDVDAAWHLHLTYTRSYWGRFCPEVLGRPLHHDPTRGGPAEARKHRAMYDRTLARYREAFGEDPPADIWPPAAERFGADLRHRAVNTARNWVIPKAPVRRAAGLAAAFAVLAVLVPGCNGGPNPFALRGTDFLLFLIPAMAVAVVVGRVLRWRRLGPGPQPGDDAAGLTWEQAAYLSAGPNRLTAAAIARLVAAGAARVGDDRKQLVRADEAPAAGFGPAERAVYDALPVGNTVADLRPVRLAVERAFADDAARLEAGGLTATAGQRAAAAVLAVAPLLLVVLGFGVPRLLVGLWFGKPVGYLVGAVVAGGLVGVVAAAAGRYGLTRRGRAVVAGLRAKSAGLRPGRRWAGAGDAGWAVGVWGTAALVGSPLDGLRAWYPRPATETGGGCGTGGCGAGAGCGGGGAGCGGGGCGGGGCGGCG